MKTKKYRINFDIDMLEDIDPSIVIETLTDTGLNFDNFAATEILTMLEITSTRESLTTLASLPGTDKHTSEILLRAAACLTDPTKF